MRTVDRGVGSGAEAAPGILTQEILMPLCVSRKIAGSAGL